MTRSIALVLLCAALLAGPPAVAADKDKKPKPPPAKVTQTLGQKVYKELEVAQKAFDAKDYKGALAQLHAMKAASAKFNDYEKATYWNFRAAVDYALDDTQAAIADYRQVLAQNSLPDAMRQQTMFALAQLHFVTDDYAGATRLLEDWFRLVADPPPDAHMLLAQIHYQQRRYKDAVQSILRGLRVAREKGVTPRESWLALLRAAYYEIDDYARSATVLEALVARYPKDTYWTQLSGMYGLLNDTRRQMQAIHVAYVGGMVTREADLLNLARLYLTQDIPYRAVGVLTRAFKDKTVEQSADNLQLYAQALALAREYEQQIPVLQQLAEMTRESKHYIYLGQAYNDLGEWDEAAGAFRKALGGRDLTDRASVAMQLGTALFNAGKLQDAREVFAQARSSSKLVEQADNWIKFVSSEIQRKQAVREGYLGRSG